MGKHLDSIGQMVCHRPVPCVCTLPMVPGISSKRVGNSLMLPVVNVYSLNLSSMQAQQAHAARAGSQKALCVRMLAV